MKTETTGQTAAALVEEAAAVMERRGESVRVTLPAGDAQAVAAAIIAQHDGCEYEPGKWDLWSEDDAWRIRLFDFDAAETWERY